MSIIYFLFPFFKTWFLANAKAEIPESLITHEALEAEMLDRREVGRVMVQELTGC